MASISTDSTGNRRLLFIDAAEDRKSIYLGKTPKKNAEAIRAKVESIVSAQTARVSLDRETAEWIGSLDEKLYGE